MKKQRTFHIVFTKLIVSAIIAIACSLLSPQYLRASGTPSGIIIHHSDDCSKENTFKETYDDMGQGHSDVLSNMEHTFTATLDASLVEEYGGLPFKWRVSERDIEQNTEIIISQINGKMYEGDSFSFTAKPGCSYSFYVSLGNGIIGRYTSNSYEKDITKIPEEPKVNVVTDMTMPKVTNISLSGLSTNIAAGKSIQLTPTVLPVNAGNKALKWTSADTKIATVTQSGKVIIKKGTGGKSVIITATAADGSGVSTSYKIKVMKGAVKKITVKGARKTLKVGKTMKLKSVVKTSKGKPVNKKVKWSSNKPKYATVTSSGKVKALKAGKGKKVKITAMATDGTGKKKSLTIKIK